MQSEKLTFKYSTYRFFCILLRIAGLMVFVFGLPLMYVLPIAIKTGFMIIVLSYVLSFSGGLWHDNGAFKE